MAIGLDDGAGTRRANESRRGGRGRLLGTGAVGATIALALAGAGLWAVPAQAAPGDAANATGQYLKGTLLGLNAGLVASLGGETAASSGAADQTNAQNLDVGVLSVVNVTAPGGIQIPLNLGGAGVVSQYASALQNGTSVGASGLTSDSGDIGTGITPKPGVAPGPLHINLAQAVSSLGLPPATLNELAQLDLSVGISGARATQTAPGTPTGSYSLAGAGLSFNSATVAGLTSAINSQVATVQNVVDGLAGPTGTLANALSILSIPGVLDTTATVTASNLQSALALLLTGDITNPSYPGVTINLSAGTVTVDLAQITGLEGLAPNTNLLSAAVITELGNRITGILGALITQIQTVLTNATDALTVNLSARVLGLPVVTVNESIGQLLAGDTSGISVAGVAVGIPLTTVLSALLGPLDGIGTAVSALGPALLAPVSSTLVPALAPTLNGVIALTVNNQSTSGGVFTETALRASVLPGTQALTLDVANASVGPNALAVPPVIDSLTPTNGPETGGTLVTITGSGFTGATGVTFDGTPGAGFSVANDTTITVASPAHTQGPVDVEVQHPIGDSAPATFTYLPLPIITSVMPGNGPESGGTAVTISGSGFTGATDVTFGGTAGANVTVVDDTTITVTSPGHAAGAVDVIVTTPAGPSGPDGFTFDPVVGPPAIGTIAPDHGPETGGTPVTITGSGFTGATGATLGGIAGTAFTVVDANTITVTTPAHAPGAVDVIVQSPAGDSAPDAFTFDPAPSGPTISGLDPNHGPFVGGTPVTVSGTGFTGATSVTIGGATVPFTVVNDATVTLTTPPHAAGAVPVVVATPVGPSPSATFTYDPGTTIDGVDPGHGPQGGGTTATITGGCFTGATGVLFGTTPATSFAVVNDATITAVAPAGTGTVDVTVVGAAPCGTGVLPGGYRYDVAPTADPGAGTTGSTHTGSALAATGSTSGGTALLGGLAVLLIACGALILIQRTRRA